MTNLYLKTSELIHSSALGFNNNLQVVKVEIKAKKNKNLEVSLHNISNLLANRFVNHYGGLKVMVSHDTLIYYFLIENEEIAFLELKKMLCNGLRFTFEEAEILAIGGQDTIPIVGEDFHSYLLVQADMLKTLASRHEAEGKKSYALLVDKLPPIKVRKMTA